MSDDSDCKFLGSQNNVPDTMHDMTVVRGMRGDKLCISPDHHEGPFAERLGDIQIDDD